MEFNRTKNSTRTFIFGVISRAITILGPFITRTIIIYKLGTEYLGLSSLFTSVLSILNMSELGIGSAITFCLYKPVAEDKRDEVRALLSLLRNLYRIIGVVILIIGLVLMPFLPFFIKNGAPPDIDIYVLYAIYLINAAASYLGFAYKAILFNVYQRGDVTHKIEVTSEIVKYILQIVVLLLFANYYWFAAMLPLSTVLVTIANEIISKRMFPDLIPQGKVSEGIIRVIRKKVLYLSANSMAATLTNSIDSIIISGAIGLTANALYGNYHYISSSVLAIIIIGYRALAPAIGNSVVSDSHDKIIEMFNSLFFIAFWVTSFCCSSMLCLYQPFIVLWVGEENLLSFVVVIMVTAYFFSNSIRQLTGPFIGALGLWNKTLPRQIIAAIMNLILDIIFVKRYGVAGIVFASFLTNSLFSLPYDFYVTYKYVLEEDIKNGVKKLLIGMTLTAILCCITYYICDYVTYDGLKGFLIKIVICALIPNALILVFSYKTKEFKYIISHLFQ